MKMTNDILQIVVGNQKKDQKEIFFSRLEEDKQAKDEFIKIKNAWALASAKKKMSEYQMERLYVNFKKQLSMKEKTNYFKISNYLKYAAIFILAISISSLFFFIQFHHPEKQKAIENYTTVIADNGQLVRIILPDSSVVWLNSGTKITYNNNFAVSNREINLNGQAFFQVTKNKEIPLRVFCKNLEVRVFGTRFDVRAYPEDQNISVVLESGKVEIFNSKVKSFHYKLNPGEMAQFDKLSEKLALKKVNVEKFTSWKDGILIFMDDPMTEVIHKLQRRYNIDIEVAQPAIYKSVFTATIKNETLDEIFKSIGYACSVQYKIIRGNNSNAKTKIILTKKF